MTTPIDETVLRERLSRRGLIDEEAGRALRATLSVLGERLVDDEAKVLADALPSDLARFIEDADYDGDFGTEEMFERVRRRMATQPARAIEDAEIVLVALGECLEPERTKRIARALPECAAELLLGRREHEAAEELPPHGSARRDARTMASGRPGSKHPISEAAPSRGHSHSVAVNDAPHAETKLSSARGATQERLHETLAEGKPPGPARPLGDAGD